MQCPGCKYSGSEVVYTRHDDAHERIARRRACLRCGLRFTTSEHLKEPRVPKDSTREQKK